LVTVDREHPCGLEVDEDDIVAELSDRHDRWPWRRGLTGEASEDRLIDALEGGERSALASVFESGRRGINRLAEEQLDLAFADTNSSKLGHYVAIRPGGERPQNGREAIGLGRIGAASQRSLER
jgi:hypothetical protein